MTKGHGLADENQNPRLWVNQLAQHIGCNEIKNISEHGWNNESIFHAAINEINYKKYDVVLIGWSTIPRYNYNIGLENYHTRSMLTDKYDIHINNKTFTGKNLEKIKSKLLEFHNDHWDILKLISYVNTIIKLQANLNGKKVFFVNTLGPWSNGYFNKINFTTPSELDDYTQGLISVETRDDYEIELIYNKIHCDYEKAGGVHETYWLNLYDSFKTMQIDNASETDKHPGLLSQDVFVEKLLPKMIRILA